MIKYCSMHVIIKGLISPVMMGFHMNQWHFSRIGQQHFKWNTSPSCEETVHFKTCQLTGRKDIAQILTLFCSKTVRHFYPIGHTVQCVAPIYVNEFMPSVILSICKLLFFSLQPFFFFYSYACNVSVKINIKLPNCNACNS